MRALDEFVRYVFTRNRDVGRRNRIANKPDYRKIRRWKVEKIKTHLLEEIETGNWNFWSRAVYGRRRMHIRVGVTMADLLCRISIEIFLKSNGDVSANSWDVYNIIIAIRFKIQIIVPYLAV